MVVKEDQEFTTEELIAELQKESPPIKPRPEGEGVTIKEWAVATGKGDRAASVELIKLMEQDVLRRERMRCADGLVRWVYFKA